MSHGNSDPETCGWKEAAEDILAAIAVAAFVATIGFCSGGVAALVVAWRLGQ